MQTKKEPGTPAAKSLQDQYTTFDPISTTFSLYKNSFCKVPIGELTITELAEKIRADREWQAFVYQLREIRRRDLALYHERKQLSFAFSAAGTFKTRRIEGLIQATSFVVLDIDKLSSVAELLRVKSVLSAEPSTILCFTSPSGVGIKAILYVRFNDGGQIANDADFKACFEQIKQSLESKHGIVIDNTRDISRLCYVSHDKSVYKNFEPEAYICTRPKPEKKTADHFFFQQKIAHVPGSSAEKYLAGVIEKAAQEIATAPRGEGNFTLNKQSFKIGQFTHTALVNRSEAERILISAFLSRGGHSEAEARKTFNSGFDAGMNADQREIPERRCA
jgi:hypothetical protein